MDRQHVRLPLSMKLLRAATRLMIMLDLPPTRLDDGAVCEFAEDETGLSDFGDPHFRVGLGELVRSLKQDADLHPLGHLVARGMITMFLIQRLRLMEARKREPGVFNRPLIPPLIVTGMARSGTTFLHNLLASDPAHRALPQWQLMRPFPGSVPDAGEPDPRIAMLERSLEFRRPMLPGLDSKHHMRADTPEECIIPLAITMNSLLFPTLFPVAGYMEWYLHNADSTLKYREYRWILQAYQAEQPTQRLTMKAPAHMGSLRSLNGEVPEAMIIQLHRHPATCVSSVCSLIQTFHRGVSDIHDVQRMADLILRLYETWLKRNLAFRELHPNFIYDINYDSFIADPIETIRGIYAHFGLPWSDSVDASLRQYIENHPKNKHGQHRYAASDFGLTEAGIADRLNFFYGEYYPIN